MLRVTAIAALMMAIAPRAADAHANLTKAEPAAGSVLSSSPPEVRLTFNEEVLPGISNLVLVQTDGRELNLRGANDSHNVRILVASLPHLPPGGYVIRWKVTSADGHPVSGSYSFVVETPPAPAVITPVVGLATSSKEPALPIVAPVLRGVGMTALLALFGMLVFLRRAEGDRGPALRPAMRWMAALATGALLLHLIAWAQSLGAASWHAVLDSTPGRLEQLRVIFALLLLISLMSASKRSLAIFFGGSAIVVSSLIGHPVGIRPLLGVPLVFAHLLAVAIWMGGICWLIGHKAEPMVRVVMEAARVSNAAFIAAAVVALTGVLETLLFVQPVSRLLTTTYGILVIAKILGLLVLVGFGWYHRFRSMPRLSGGSSLNFTQTLSYELTAMVTVVVIAGFLAYTPTPR